MKKKLFLLPVAALSLGLGIAVATKPAPIMSVARAEEEEIVEIIEDETPVVDETEKTETTELDKIKEAVTSVINKWDVENIFSPTNIMIILEVFLSSGFGIALVKVYAKYKSEKTITREAIYKSVEETLPKLSEKVLGDITTKVLAPLASSVGSMEEAMAVFSKCLALSQENTPEARLAILDELSKIKIKDESVIAKVDEAIKRSVAEAQRLIDEKLALLKEMEQFQKATEVLKKADEVLTEKAEEISDDGTSI